MICNYQGRRKLHQEIFLVIIFLIKNYEEKLHLQRREI
jgi:hypothetical protein